MVKCIFSCFQCVWIENQGFQLHQGYRCNCKQGYEYPWKEANEYFYTGDLIEDSRLRYVANRTNRYERLKCRMSSATHASGLLSTVVLSLIVALWLKWFVPNLDSLWKDYMYFYLDSYLHMFCKLFYMHVWFIWQKNNYAMIYLYEMCMRSNSLRSHERYLRILLIFSYLYITHSKF